MSSSIFIKEVKFVTKSFHQRKSTWLWQWILANINIETYIYVCVYICIYINKKKYAHKKLIFILTFWVYFFLLVLQQCNWDNFRVVNVKNVICPAFVLLPCIVFSQGSHPQCYYFYVYAALWLSPPCSANAVLSLWNQ